MKCEQAHDAAGERLMVIQFEGDWQSICRDGEIHLERRIPLNQIIKDSAEEGATPDAE